MLGTTRFDREMAKHAHAERVSEYLKSGLASGVRGAPPFFINGVRHDGSYDSEALLAEM